MIMITMTMIFKMMILIMTSIIRYMLVAGMEMDLKSAARDSVVVVVVVVVLAVVLVLVVVVVVAVVIVVVAETGDLLRHSSHAVFK